MRTQKYIIFFKVALGKWTVRWLKRFTDTVWKDSGFFLYPSFYLIKHENTVRQMLSGC
jgi:hypothetical protein